MIKIELSGIWHRYPGMSAWALENVSAVFSSSRIILVSGHNGSGKTTLLKIAALLYRPLRGEVMVNNRSFWKMNEIEKAMIRRSIAYVHEKPILIRGSVFENIAYPLKIRGLDRRDVAEKVEKVLGELELVEYVDKSAKELSAGQSQLVAIARALVADPELIFLDEPFAHLDTGRSELVAMAFRERRRNGAGIVIASHGGGEMPDGLEPDEVMMLEGGRIRWRQAPERLERCEEKD